MGNYKNSAFLLALAANVMWGSSFVGSKYTLLTWGPYVSVFMRFGLSIIALLVSYRLIGLKIEIPRTGKQWAAVTIVGLILGALYPLQVSGMLYITSGLSAAIMLLAPVILVILASLLGDEKIERQKILAIGLGILGGLVLLYKNLTFVQNAGLGTWLTLGAAACLAVYTFVNRKFSRVINHPTMTLWSFVIGSIVVAPFAFFEQANRGPIANNHLIESSVALIYLAIVCTALPFFIWNKATVMTETKNLASTMHAKTPVAILLGALMFHESLTVPLIIGTVIVSFALWLSQAQNIFVNSRKGKGEKANGQFFNESSTAKSN